MTRQIDKQRLPVGSGYETLFGKNRLALAITQTQAAKISEGSDIERKMMEVADQPLSLANLDELECLVAGFLPESDKCYAISKADIKKYLWPYLLAPHVENWDELSKKERAALCQKHFVHDPDLAFVDTKARTITFVELKTYCVFDTEKSQAIANKLHDMPLCYNMAYKARSRVVCFYAKSVDDVIDGMKKKISPRVVMTGEHLLKQISSVTMKDFIGQHAAVHEENVFFLLQSAITSAQAINPERLRELMVNLSP